MPTTPHERAHGGLYINYVKAQMVLMKAGGSSLKWIDMTASGVRWVFCARAGHVAGADASRVTYDAPGG